MSEYSEKLRDPRWQKLRLQVFERDKWKCLACLDEKKTLMVHHLVYSGKEPWESPPDELETLCEDCHDLREGFNTWIGGRSTTPTSVVLWIGCVLLPGFVDKTDHWKNSGGDFFKFMNELLTARKEYVKAFYKDNVVPIPPRAREERSDEEREHPQD